MSFETENIITASELDKAQRSWLLVLANPIDFGRLFYEKLFELSPELKTYFKSDITSQSEKFTSTVTVIITKLNGGYSFVGDVRFLAKRHVEYGVRQEHFAVVGEALLLALEEGLGDKWNTELNRIWRSVYNTLAGAMIKMAKEYDDKFNVA